jgi:hypothetical protein
MVWVAFHSRRIYRLRADWGNDPVPTLCREHLQRSRRPGAGFYPRSSSQAVLPYSTVKRAIVFKTAREGNSQVGEDRDCCELPTCQLHTSVKWKIRWIVRLWWGHQINGFWVLGQRLSTLNRFRGISHRRLFRGLRNFGRRLGSLALLSGCVHLVLFGDFCARPRSGLRCRWRSFNKMTPSDFVVQARS